VVGFALLPKISALANRLHQLVRTAASYPPALPPTKHRENFGDNWGKKGAFKSVILRDAAFATENLNTHIRLYLCGDDAYSRMKTKCIRLASNPIPSAIAIQWENPAIFLG
jgi:hypothetical protein